jgi:carbonic anhydrase
MDELSSALDRNKAWSAERQRSEPDYFSRLAAVQDPDILWIGCSDSPVPADTVTGLTPGEIFVHQNVANIVYAADLNCMSVMQSAVEVLRVAHIIVCDHYGCGGMIAAYEDKQNGLIDHWLEPIKITARRHRMKRLTHVVYGPYRDGISAHGAPVLNRQKIPFNTRRHQRGQRLAIYSAAMVE